MLGEFIVRLTSFYFMTAFDWHDFYLYYNGAF